MSLWGAPAPASGVGSGLSLNDTSGAVALVAVALAAFLVPLLARRVRMPGFVLEILFGLLVGPVLGWIEGGSGLIGLLAELGLFLLLFLAGFEIDFGRLKRGGGGQVATGLGLWGLFLAAAWWGVGFLDVPSTQGRWFLSLLVSAAAVGLVVPALRESQRSATRLGQLTLISAVLAEGLSLLGIIGLTVVASGGAGWRWLSVPALLAAVGVVLWGLRRAAWWHPERFERLFRRDDPQEMGIRASLALLFVFVGLAILLDVEAILGAFLAGALFSFVFRRPGPLAERLRGFSFGFFVPVFFINVGLSFPLDQLRRPEALAEAGLLIVVAFAAKLVPSLALMLRRFSWRESLAAGALLAGQLSVVIALADLGLGLGLIGPAQHAGAILLVVVGAVLAPMLFQTLAPPMEPGRSRLPGSEAEGRPG